MILFKNNTSFPAPEHDTTESGAVWEYRNCASFGGLLVMQGTQAKLQPAAILLCTEPKTRCHPFSSAHSSLLREEVGSGGRESLLPGIQGTLAWNIPETKILNTWYAMHCRLLRSKYLWRSIIRQGLTEFNYEIWVAIDLNFLMNQSRNMGPFSESFSKSSLKSLVSLN